MSFRKKTLLGIITVFILTIVYNSYFPVFLVTGEYEANIEDDYATYGVDNGDKLVLNKNGTFDSDSWGKGTYKINGAEITFKFDNDGFHTHFNRPMFFGKPRIIIFRDLGSEFIKK